MDNEELNLSPEQMSRLNSFKQQHGNLHDRNLNRPISPVAGQPDSKATVLAGNAKPSKEKYELDHRETYRGAEMSRRRIEQEAESPFLGAVNFKKIIYRTMRISGYGIMIYDAVFSYQAFVIVSSAYVALPISIGILYLNYGLMDSSIEDNIMRVFRVDFNNDGKVSGQEWMNWVKAAGALSVIAIGLGFDFWTNYLGFSYQDMNILGLPGQPWMWISLCAVFLMLVGHFNVYIADRRLQQLAYETPDAKAQAAEVGMRNAAATMINREGQVEAQEAGRQMGIEKGKAIAKSIRWGR